MTLFLLLLGLLLGLLTGSFLNVVIHRLPRMLEAAWEADQAAWQAERQGLPAPPAGPRYDLAQPPSHCPSCHTPIRWYQLIPLLSWLWQRGRCAHCSQRISLRYPLVELLTAGFGVWCALHYGLTPAALLWFGFACLLLVMALIDWDTTYLPDSLTLPLLWLGLLGSSLGWLALPLQQAVWGAAAGYGMLWLVSTLFRLFTGKTGMGSGDLKLLAALGAWFGLPALLPLVLLSALAGSVAGLLLLAGGRLREDRHVPFGPFLALAGWTCWLLPLPVWLQWPL